MKDVVLMVVSLLLALNVSAMDKKTFTSKIKRRIASTYEAGQGDKVFNKFVACKETEKDADYLQKVSKCMDKHFDKGMSDSKKIDLVVFMLAGENFSSLDKCSYEVLERHPTVINDDSDFILCSDFKKGSRNKTAIIFFERRGKDLLITNLKD